MTVGRKIITVLISKENQMSYCLRGANASLEKEDSMRDSDSGHEYSLT